MQVKNQENLYKQEFEKLNSEQKQVVEQINWSVMVVAGPWTGKTQIIWMRTANIIKSAWVNPENILITTFTEAWVIAIKKRLTRFIWTDAYKVKVATFHSFAQDIITSYPEKFTEFKASSTIDDVESLQVLTDIIDKNIKNNNIEYLFTAFDRYMYLRDIKDRIWKLKWEWVSFDKFEKIIAEQRSEYDEKLEELKTNKRIRDLEKRTAKDSETYKKHIWKLNELNLIYKEYSDYLKKNSLYDFSDMINFTVEALEKDEDLKYDLAEKYQYIMLDEYQDTNNSQNKLIDLILSVWDSKNIMTVWDDDQSIYRFQGANIENMLDFVSTYPDTKFIVLKNNYRSAQSILDLSTNLIENNSQRLVNKLPNLKKELISQVIYKDLDNNKYFILEDEILEKLFVVEDIKKKSPHSISPIGREIEQNTFAIICRSNREVEEWTSFMQLQWLEVESKLKTNILKNKFVEFILDFLALIENPNFSDEKLLDILRTDIIDVENIDVVSLAKILYKINYSKSGFKTSLWSFLKNLDSDFLEKNKILDVEKKAIFELDLENIFNNYKKIIEFRDLILELNSELGLYWISRLFQKLLDKIWLVEYIEEKGSFSDLEDIFTLFNKIKEFNEKNPDLTIEQLINKFELHKKYNISIPRQILKKSNSNIEILTAHASKGLEYDYVYIPWVYAGNWESKRIVDKLKLPRWIAWNWLQFAGLSEKELKNSEKEISLQEDRRLFFVAMTRAKKELIFTRSAGRDNKPFIDSPFVMEAGVEAQQVIPHSVSPKGREAEQSFVDLLKKELLWEKPQSNSKRIEGLIKTTSEEIEYIKEFLENYKLSPTDLNTFLEDPKQFLRNVVFKYPFTGNEFTIFGNVYHKVLEIFTLQKISPHSVSPKGREVATLGEMTEKFLELLKYQILTAEERDRLTKKWIEGLTWYYEYFIKNSRVPLAVEYNFRSRDVVFEGVRITGKVDKVEKIWDTLNNPPIPNPFPPREKGDFKQNSLFVEDVAVVDYKTGSIKTIWKIKWVDRYWNKKDDLSEGKYYRQLLFYKLLAENDPEFSSKYNTVELALDFVEGKNWEYKYVAVPFEREDYEEFKELVKDSWEKINSLEFWEEVLK